MFVPLAAFAAIVTLLMFLTLYVVPLIRNRPVVGTDLLISFRLLVPCISKLRPITQTRWELLWIGILSVFWLGMALFFFRQDDSSDTDTSYFLS